MNKETISLGAMLVRANILPDNMLDVSITTEERDTVHYVQTTAEQTGMRVQELIEDLADTALDGTGRQMIYPFHARNLHGADLQSFFERYIERKRYLAQHTDQTADTLICEGACKEAEVWLEKCGYNLDEERIAELVNGDRQIYRQEADSLYRTAKDFLVISADPFFLHGVKGYLVGWTHDNDAWENNITSQLLFVPELSAWSETAKNNAVTAKGLPGYPRRFRYRIAAMDGPKVLLHSNMATETEPEAGSGRWESIRRKVMNLPVIDMIATGENLNEMRVSHGLSVSAIRDYLGLNTTYAVYKWFHGESIPSVDNLLALSMLFNTSINELLVYHT